MEEEVVVFFFAVVEDVFLFVVDDVFLFVEEVLLVFFLAVVDVVPVLEDVEDVFRPVVEEVFLFVLEEEALVGASSCRISSGMIVPFFLFICLIHKLQDFLFSENRDQRPEQHTDESQKQQIGRASCRERV